MQLPPERYLRKMGLPLNPAFADDWNPLHIHKALACLPRPDARSQSRARGFNSGTVQSFLFRGTEMILRVVRSKETQEAMAAVQFVKGRPIRLNGEPINSREAKAMIRHLVAHIEKGCPHYVSKSEKPS